MSIVSGTIAAFKGSDAIKSAANTSADASRHIYDDAKNMNMPFYNQGLAALPGVNAAANATLPTYEDTVTKPMEAWDYNQSPAYTAKYSLGMEELNKQLQARGLGSSGVGATRAADLSRKLTSEDYNSERSYALGQKTDLYKSRYSENTDRYNKLLDQVKMGTGASASMGQAGNAYASGVGNAAMQAGNAQANLYSGLGGLTGQAASTGLKAYDMGNKAGWWGSTAATSSAPAMQTAAQQYGWSDAAMGADEAAMML